MLFCDPPSAKLTGPVAFIVMVSVKDFAQIFAYLTRSEAHRAFQKHPCGPSVAHRLPCPLGWKVGRCESAGGS